MTDYDIEKKFEKVKELFTEYVEIVPSFELRETESVMGKHIKLRVGFDDDPYQILSMIFFELHYLLHKRNKKDDGGGYKMIISELILSPIIPNFYGARGFIIKIEYIK